MSEVTLKGIVHENKVSKNTGKSFVSCRLQVFSNNLQKDVWLSGFGDAITETWSTGDVVDIDIIPNGEYFNWKANDNTKASPDKKLLMLQRIESKLDIIIGKLNARPQENAEIAKEIAKEFNGEVDNDGETFGLGGIDVAKIPF
jgi:hypothetical protein